MDEPEDKLEAWIYYILAALLGSLIAIAILTDHFV